MSQRFLAGATFASALCLAGVAHATTNLITNGDFTTGNFSGWTLTTTANGTYGPSPMPQVASFDVTGTGAQDAAQFEVGEANFDGSQQGAELLQSFTAAAGVLNFSAAIASEGDTTVASSNADGGVYTVFLDGTSEATFSVGPIAANQVVRDNLSFTAPVTAGSHSIEILMTRGFTTGDLGNTPFQFVTNVSATEGAVVGVPEPTSWALILAGFGAMGATLRRRRVSPVPS
jgi:hypothetical protein